MNKVILIGNLGNAGELKVFADNNAVLNFSVATSEKWTDKQTNEKKEKTEWHRCKLFGKRGQALAQYMTKGTKVAVTGAIETRSYEKDGVKHYATEIKVLDVELLGGPKAGANTAPDPDGLDAPDEGGEEPPF